MMTRMISRGKSSSAIIYTARTIRQGMTPSERILWNALRGRKLAGLKFRSQHPLDHYVLDFFCTEQMLAIEVDGGIHLQAENKEFDRERTLFLQEQGIHVLRFSNSEVCGNLEEVLNRIMEYVEKNPIKSR